MTAQPAREFREEFPIQLLDAPELDARIERNEAELDALGDDILRRGMIYPIVVVRVGERFEIVEGYSRYLAAMRKNIVAVPVFIYPTKEAALEGVKYAGNAYRQDMSPADEANFFDELLKGECAGDVEKLCAMTGRSFNYVSDRLALFNGYQQVFDAVRAKQISLGIAARLNKFLPPEWVDYYLEQCIRTGATISTLEGWLQEWKAAIGNQLNAPKAPAAPAVEAPASTHDPNTCILCSRADHTYAIRWRPMHTHCELAILEPLLRGAASSAD